MMITQVGQQEMMIYLGKVVSLHDAPLGRVERRQHRVGRNLGMNMSVRTTLLSSIHGWSAHLEGVVGAAVVEVVAEAGDEQRQRLQLRDHAATQQVKALDQLASDASVMEKNWKIHSGNGNLLISMLPLFNTERGGATL